MVWTKNLGTVYHQQDTNYYCGAATAQMILDQIGAGLLDQAPLYNSNHSHNTDPTWYTDPDGLAYTLRHFKPANFTNTFVVYNMASEVQGSEKIVYTLWKYGVATGTPVYWGTYGWAHWITVRGVSTSVEPKPGSTYSINGFWINNPWPPCPSFYNPTLAPPPLHNTTDGCGSGSNRGIDNEYIVYDGGSPGALTWRGTYFVGCDWPPGGGHRYISVCDPEPPKLGKLTMKNKEFWAKGDKIVSTQYATNFAMRGIDEHRIREDKLFNKALEGAEPSTPILVQRLDLLDTFYYIVPMTRKETTTSMLIVDALYGNFAGGRAFTEPTRKPFVDRKETLERLLGQAIELGDKKGKLTIRKEAYCFYPIMVWCPCKESRSPYYPFYMVSVGAHKLYIGYDGTVYTDLHPMGPG